MYPARASASAQGRRLCGRAGEAVAQHHADIAAIGAEGLCSRQDGHGAPRRSGRPAGHARRGQAVVAGVDSAAGESRVARRDADPPRAPSS